MTPSEDGAMDKFTALFKRGVIFKTIYHEDTNVTESKVINYEAEPVVHS
jgi:hypothetical protein